jgi:ring-1,2-phenylacetyl-CoA epoxidase subunit PaaC
MKAAAEELAPYVGELFVTDNVTEEMVAAGIAPDPASLRPEFDRTIGAVFAEAGLEIPTAPWTQSGGRQGRHGEAMGYLLAELQYMQRTYPGATW